MSLRPRSRSVALLLGLVPGWGHVYWGREFQGLALFTGGAVLGFVFLNGLFVYQGPARDTLIWVSGGGLLAGELAVWIDLFRRTRSERRRHEEKERERLIDVGTVAYLQNDYATAIESFRQCLRLDPQDVDAMFRLGVAHVRANEVREGKRWLRKTLRHDLEEKWCWEVGRELARLRRGAGGGGGDARKDRASEQQDKEHEEEEKDAERASLG